MRGKGQSTLTFVPGQILDKCRLALLYLMRFCKGITSRHLFMAVWSPMIFLVDLVCPGRHPCRVCLAQKTATHFQGPYCKRRCGKSLRQINFGDVTWQWYKQNVRSKNLLAMKWICAGKCWQCGIFENCLHWFWVSEWCCPVSVFRMSLEMAAPIQRMYGNCTTIVNTLNLCRDHRRPCCNALTSVAVLLSVHYYLV